MGQIFKEINDTPHLSHWEINRPGPRRYQTKQRKLKLTEDLSGTSYCGWVTTEDILKSKRVPRTTIGKLARLNRVSHSTSQGREFKIRLGTLSTAISQSQVKHYFHHDKLITSYNNFYHDGSESTGIFVNHEYHQRQHKSLTTAVSSNLIEDSLLLNSDIKMDKIGFGKTNVNKVDLNESYGISTFTRPSSELSISNPMVDKQEVRVNTLNSTYLSGDKEKIKSSEPRGKYQVDIDKGVHEEKSVSQNNYEESFTPENSGFEEFDQGIDDVDFLAAEPETFTPGDKLLSIEKESYSKSTQSPSLFLMPGRIPSVTYQIESKVDSCSIDKKIPSLQASEHDNIPEKPVAKKISQSLLQENQISPSNIKAKKTSQKTSILEKNANQSLLLPEKLKESEFQVDLRACIELDHTSKTKTQQNKLKTGANHISKSFLDNQNCELDSRPVASVPSDRYESRDPGIFSRIGFPQLVSDDSPIIGLSSNYCLRTCFHIQEMINEAQRFMTLNTAPVIELFTHVVHSYREPNTTRQKFYLSDIWLDKSSFLDGILLNYKATELIDQESQIFIGNDSKELLARILATPKRREEKRMMNQNSDTNVSSSSSSSWLLQIICIRKTDFEEINWTRRIVNAY